MRYRQIESDSGEGLVPVYVLPLAADPSRYRIVYPLLLERCPEAALARGAVEVRRFQGCDERALEDLCGRLRSLVDRRAQAAQDRNTTLFVAGVAVAALGIVNVVLPDPVPALDETLLIGGGALAAFWAARRRNRELPLLWARVEEARKEIDRLDAREDPLLTRLHRALAHRDRPEAPSEAAPQVDEIERQAAWLVEDLDLRTALARDPVSREELAKLTEVLESSFALRGPAHSRRREAHPGRRRRLRLARRLGLSSGTLIVYQEFCRVAREVLEGEP